MKKLVIGLIMLALPTAALAAKPAPAPATPADAAKADIKATFGFVPGFMSGVSPWLLPGAWDEMKSLQMNPNTALPPKIKELLGLAVASQIPCEYCVFAHTEFAKLNGATDAEIGEAIALAALTRHWSTFMNGVQLSQANFDKDLQRFVDAAKKGPPTSAPIEVTDAASAKADMQRAFGFVPEFMNVFPESALAGAYRGWRDLELNPSTALPGKYKTLIGLAVAAQVPCHYCIKADTTFAKLEGATDPEIREAVAMASLVRQWSTLLNGHQINKPAFQGDVRKLVATFRKKRTS